MSDRPVSNGVARPKWTELNDLASQDAGGQILFATDDWFAAAENLINSAEPVWKEGFTQQGKWMDGWETRRKRIPGHDWCIIQLGLPGRIHGIEIGTDFFTGNNAPKASIQAVRMKENVDLPKRDGIQGIAASKELFQEVEKLNSDTWREIVPITSLGPGYKDTARTFVPVDSSETFTHIRLNIYPDGGVSRLRVYGTCTPMKVPASSGEVDLLAAKLGGVCVGYSNAHYGHPRNMIREGRGKDMGDGWETARKNDRPSILKAGRDGILQVPGCEWACFKLGYKGTISRIEVDTNHFKGNFPDSVIIDAANVSGNIIEAMLSDTNKGWNELLPASKLTPHSRHFYEQNQIQNLGPITHIRVRMFPDGGISRIRIFGQIDQ